jgi:hypothetical protein
MLFIQPVVALYTLGPDIFFSAATVLNPVVVARHYTPINTQGRKI